MLASAAPPSTGASTAAARSPVASAVFRRLECSHEELFQPEYKRSNRTKGLKILRCFPHCCPNHMERSYCGSALHVIVHTTKPLAPPLETEPPPPTTTTTPDEYQSEALAVGDLAVFARFESASDPGLEVGECLSFGAVSASTQSEENPEGRWIPSSRERASPALASSSAQSVDQESSEQNALVYQLNGKIYSRWYYDWESGANKAQRLMKHVLKAYVFEKCVVDAAGNILTSLGSSLGPPPPSQALLYRVASVIVSPEFTVISYRRAPSDGLGGVVKSDSLPPYYSASQQQQMHQLQLQQQQLHHHQHNQLPQQQYQHQHQQRVVSPAASTHVPIDRTKRPLGATTVDAHIKKDRWNDSDRAPATSYPSYDCALFYPDASDPRSMKRRRPTDSFVRPIVSNLRLPPTPSPHHPPPLPPPPPPPSATSSFPSTSSSSVPIHSIEDTLLWEHAHASAVTTSKNLALLYWFAQSTPLATYAPFVDELVHITQRRLLEPLAPTSLPVAKINCFSRVLLEQADVAAGANGGAVPALPYQLEALLRVVAQAVLWIHSESTRQWFRAFFQQHAANALNKQALRASFLALLAETEERLNHHVFVMTPLKSVANAAEEIIAAVYSYERFHAKRPRVRQILGAQGFAGWSAFVAQLRDMYIAASGAGGGRRQRGAPAPAPGAPAVASSFRRTALVRNAFEHRWNHEWVLDMEEAVWKQSEPGSASLLTLFDLVAQIGRLELALGVQERTLRVRSTTSLAPGTDSMRLVLDGRERVCRLLPNGVSTAVSAGCAGDYVGSIHMEGRDRLVVYLELFRWAAVASERSHHVRMRVECWRNNRLYVNGEVLASAPMPPLASEEGQPFLGEMKLRAKRQAAGQALARQLQAAAPGGGGASAAAAPAWTTLGRFRLSYHCL